MEKKLLAENAVYQIYPSSFKDSNGDGRGDIRGIISKLDYLQSLGIKLVWLSPIYASPLFDMGYDISDYYKINPLYGTMDDFDELLREAKKRDMKIIMDLVVNHTSDKCKWFEEAIKNPSSPYRDYYIFKEGKNNKAPNNWTSTFLGSAWEKVPNEENTYYLHIFDKKQPDLNWHNPHVYEEVKNIMNFWLDKGVYGFRCDVISIIYKESFEDGGKSRIGAPIGSEHYVATPGCHQILKRLRKDTVDLHNGILIGECFGSTLADCKDFIDNGELDTFFQFDLANLDSALINPRVNTKKFVQGIKDWQNKVDWNGNYLENHDQRRSVGRYCTYKDSVVGSKMLLTLVYTLRGTPFIYQGEELGARDYPALLPIDDSRDCVTKYIYKMATSYHMPKKMALKIAMTKGRDNERAPMAFSSKEGYGFSDPLIKPWMPYNPTCKTLNVENEEKDEDSTLHFFRKINQLRTVSPSLCYGTIKFMESQKDVLIFIREYEKEKTLVILNMTSKKRVIPNYDSYEGKELLLANYHDSYSDKLRPYEALVYRIK